MGSELESIIAELVDAETKVVARIEQLFGKVGTTDFASEYAEFQDALTRLKALVKPEEEKVPGPEVA